jgi:hypothetical protein
MNDLVELYASSYEPSAKAALILYISNRADISKKAKLNFLLNVMQTTGSLKAFGYAERSFNAITQQNFEVLDLKSLLQWWKDNQAKLSG